jgi:hypothetical protein
MPFHLPRPEILLRILSITGNEVPVHLSEYRENNVVKPFRQVQGYSPGILDTSGIIG